MGAVKDRIKEMVDRETQAWDTRDVDLLLSVFHPDMVWPWPPTAQSHDPMDWIMVLGRFSRARWRESFRLLFDTHQLIHNHRDIRKIVVSEQGDGAFAVVDIDTQWLDRAGNPNHWKGRVCKVFTKMPDGEWKLIMHTGVLEY